MEFLQEIRESLLASQQELERRLSAITSDVRHEGQPLSGDWEEQAVERQNDEVLDALGNAAREELVQIKKALRRIDSGEYPFCTECGNEIGEARLRSLPYAELCVNCAENHEK